MRRKLAKRVAETVLVGLMVAPTPIWAQAPKVVVTLKPLHGLVAGVMQGVDEPELLLTGNASPHNFVLRPSDARKLQRADLVVRVADTLETFLSQSLAASKQSGRVLTLMEEPGMRLLSFRGHEHEHDEEEPEDSRRLAPVTDERPERGSLRNFDPHIWLDPENAAAIVEIVVRDLTALDPENGGHYSENGKRIRQQVAAMDEQLSSRLASVRGVPFLVYHDAIRYFTRHYGLAMVGTVTDGAAHKPGVKRILDFKRQAQITGARCLFAEPQTKAATIENIARESSLKTGLLDPLGADVAPGPDAWFQVMRNITESLRGCLDSGDGKLEVG